MGPAPDGGLGSGDCEQGSEAVPLQSVGARRRSRRNRKGLAARMPKDRQRRPALPVDSSSSSANVAVNPPLPLRRFLAWCALPARGAGPRGRAGNTLLFAKARLAPPRKKVTASVVSDAVATSADAARATRFDLCKNASTSSILGPSFQKRDWLHPPLAPIFPGKRGSPWRKFEGAPLARIDGLRIPISDAKGLRLDRADPSRGVFSLVPSATALLAPCLSARLCF